MGFFDSIKKNVMSAVDFLKTNGGQGYFHGNPVKRETTYKPPVNRFARAPLPEKKAPDPSRFTAADMNQHIGDVWQESYPWLTPEKSARENFADSLESAWTPTMSDSEKRKYADGIRGDVKRYEKKRKKRKDKENDLDDYVEAKTGDQALADWLSSDGKVGYGELVLDGTPESLNNFYDLIQESPEGAWDLFKETPKHSGLADIVMAPGNAIDRTFSKFNMEKKTKNLLAKESEANARKRYDDWMENLMANEDNWINDVGDINRIAGELKSAGIHDTGLAGLYADWAPIATANMEGEELTAEDLISVSNAYRLGILGDYMADGSNKGIFGKDLGALSHYLSPIMAGQIGSDYFLPGKTEGVTGIGAGGGKWSEADQGIDSEQFRRYARSSGLNFSYDDLKDMLEREYGANIYDIIGPSQLAGYGGDLDAIKDKATRARIEESLKAAKHDGKKGKGKK